MLNAQQLDFLKELINVFIGKAANMLSEMANQRVMLSVPEVDILNASDFDNMRSVDEILFANGHVVSSSLNFGHNFSGRASLIFPANKAKSLVDSCLGEFAGDIVETDYKNLADTDFDVLREISNIILNSVVGEFGNFLEVKLNFSLPDIELFFVTEDEQKIYLKNDVHILVFYTSFLLSKADVKGVVLVSLGLNSLSMLVSKIDEMMGEYYD